MIFISLDFIIFIVVVFTVYWLLGRKLQNIFLLVASYFFYGYVHHLWLILIITLTAVNFYFSLAIEKYSEKKKLLLIMTIIINLGILGTYKYFGFFVENVNAMLMFAGFPTLTNSLQILLPVGISFYTFQSLGYTIDVYRGDLTPRKNIIDFSLFVAFFPQLVAGPIERASHLLKQIEEKRHFCPVAVREGMYLMIWGFFKKIVIADNVAIYCNKVFFLSEPSFYLLWAGVFAFCIQIFADFSAYTDIARGASRLLGFNLMNNFNNPYISISPSDFWRRWHISLSAWIRDYIYIPLGGSKSKKPIRQAFNLVFTFFLCGLWHGASWNFAIWGLYHGFLILIYRFVKRLIPKSVKRLKILFPFKMLLMFLLTTIGWLFFRETDIHMLLKYLLLSPLTSSELHTKTAIYIFALTMIYSLPLWVHTVFTLTRNKMFLNHPNAFIIFKTVAAALLFIGILCMHSKVSSEFIYFQF